MANSLLLQAGLIGFRTYTSVFLRAARSLHSTTVSVSIKSTLEDLSIWRRTRRGTRAGQSRPVHFSRSMSRNITADHLHPSLAPPQGERAIVRFSLRRLVQQSTLCPPGQLELPTLFVFNAASLAKPHAIEQLQTDLIGYSVDVAVVSETHFKKKPHLKF